MNVQFKFDAFLSHAWGVERADHYLVRKVNEALRSKRVRTWFDEENLGGNMRESIIQGIAQSACFVIFLTSIYNEKIKSGSLKDFCYFEFNYATKVSKQIIWVILDKEMKISEKWCDRIQAECSHELYLDFSAFSDPSALDPKLVEDLIKKICSSDNKFIEVTEIIRSDFGRVAIVPPSERNPKELEFDFPIEGVRLSYLKELQKAAVSLCLSPISDVITHVVLVRTRNEKTSLVSLLKKIDSGLVGRADVFISHAREMNFDDFCASLYDHFDGDDPFIWVNFISNNLYFPKELDFNSWFYTFRLGIRAINHTVVVFDNWRDPLALKKSWCLWEIFCTVENAGTLEFAIKNNEKIDLENFLKSYSLQELNSPLNLDIKKLLNVNSKQSGCADPEAGAAIRNAIVTTIDYSELDELICEMIEIFLKKIINARDALDTKAVPAPFISKRINLGVSTIMENQRNNEFNWQSIKKVQQWNWRKNAKSTVSLLNEYDLKVIGETEVTELLDSAFPGNNVIDILYKLLLNAHLYRLKKREFTGSSFLEFGTELERIFHGELTNFFPVEIIELVVNVLENLWIGFDDRFYNAQIRKDVTKFFVAVLEGGAEELFTKKNENRTTAFVRSTKKGQTTSSVPLAAAGGGNDSDSSSDGDDRRNDKHDDAFHCNGKLDDGSDTEEEKDFNDGVSVDSTDNNHPFAPVITVPAESNLEDADVQAANLSTYSDLDADVNLDEEEITSRLLQEVCCSPSSSDNERLTKRIAQFLGLFEYSESLKLCTKLGSYLPFLFNSKTAQHGIMKFHGYSGQTPNYLSVQGLPKLRETERFIDLYLREHYSPLQVQLFNISQRCYSFILSYKTQLKDKESRLKENEKYQKLVLDYSALAVSRASSNVYRFLRRYDTTNTRMSFIACKQENERDWNTQAHQLLMELDTFLKKEKESSRFKVENDSNAESNRFKKLQKFGNTGLYLVSHTPKANLSIAFASTIRAIYWSIRDHSFDRGELNNILSHCKSVFKHIYKETYYDEYDLKTIRQLLSVLELVCIELNDNLHFNNDELRSKAKELIKFSCQLLSLAEKIVKSLGVHYDDNNDPLSYIQSINRVKLRFHLSRADDHSLLKFPFRTSPPKALEHLNSEMKYHLDERKLIAKFIRRAYESTETGGLVDMFYDLGYRVFIEDLPDFQNGAVIAIKNHSTYKAVNYILTRVEFVDIYVILRGSNGFSPKDWQCNVQLVDFGLWKIFSQEQPIPGVHMGFVDRADKLFFKINKRISKMLDNLLKSIPSESLNVSLSFAGHSQGAALALLLGLKYNDSFPNFEKNLARSIPSDKFKLYKTTKVWTFAFPGTFTNENIMRDKFVRHCNVNVYHDPVPRLGQLSGFHQTARPNNFFKQSLPHAIANDIGIFGFISRIIGHHRPLTYDIMMQHICSSQTVSEYLINLKQAGETHGTWIREQIESTGVMMKLALSMMKGTMTILALPHRYQFFRNWRYKHNPNLFRDLEEHHHNAIVITFATAAMYFVAQYYPNGSTKFEVH